MWHLPQVAEPPTTSTLANMFYVIYFIHCTLTLVPEQFFNSPFISICSPPTPIRQVKWCPLTIIIIIQDLLCVVTIPFHQLHAPTVLVTQSVSIVLYSSRSPILLSKVRFIRACALLPPPPTQRTLPPFYCHVYSPSAALNFVTAKEERLKRH